MPLCAACHTHFSKFYQLQSRIYLCEQCCVNDIYSAEVSSQTNTLSKLVFKMQNIIKLRQKKQSLKQGTSPSMQQQTLSQQQQIQQVNLLYDLVHVEVEKIRRKAINQIVQQQTQQQ